MLPRFSTPHAFVMVRNLGVAFLSLTALSAPNAIFAAPSPGFQVLPGHIPAAVMEAQTVAPLDTTQPISLALSLPLRHQAELDDLLRGLSDPEDARYGQFLTPEEFTERFSPTAAEYARVIAYAKSMGLTVTATHANRTLLDVSAPAGQIGKAFGLHLLVYKSIADGRYFYAPDAEPQVPSALASLVSGVVGLNNSSRWQPHLRQKQIPEMSAELDPYAQPLETGSGPNGGLSPTDIKTAYNLSSVTQNGSGQTLGLLELDGYTASDITAYESSFGLPAVPLQNVLVDGYSGAAGSGAAEVTLDIELQAALAPGASKILVYEGPNSDAGVVDTYNRIASDNTAKEISTSWGEAENSAAAATRNSENTAFQQMASQGQSIFAAAGDSGADDNGSSLSVDDPASQPYVVGVGGTSLTTNGAGGAYKSETTWNGGSVSNGAGGGGISTVWTIPSYQSGVVGSSASKGSTTHRNVPDVSLDADPNTGYAVYFQGGWTIYGGTSCAAPLWAAFTSLVNQKRAAAGSSLLGFANTSIYSTATSSAYMTDFHDIADGSTNLYYPAVTGYDDATGWGSFNGANLLTALSGGTTTPPPPTVPAAPTALKATPGNAQVALSWTGSSGAATYNLYRSTTTGTETLYKSGLTATSYTDTGLTNGTAYFYKVAAVNSAGTSALSTEASATPKAAATVTQLLGNPSFENGSSKPAPWTVTAGVIDSSTGEPAHSGSWKAWLDGYGTTHTDTIAQTVTLPTAISTANLSFYLHIDTAETTKTTAYDTLKVQLRNSSGTVLTTLATYSNLNAVTGYSLKTFNVAAYKGQTVLLYLVGTEDSSLQTSFVVDDFTLNVQ
ncbi:MAG: protease pro-enzyme activation domain-containing protein [Janthinobacterium lividum]